MSVMGKFDKKALISIKLAQPSSSSLQIFCGAMSQTLICGESLATHQQGTSLDPTNTSIPLLSCPLLTLGPVLPCEATCCAPGPKLPDVGMMGDFQLHLLKKPTQKMKQ